MMRTLSKAPTPVPFDVIHHFPFDVVEMKGNDSVDFLQRISTGDLSNFVPGTIRKTLLITDKGRMIDTIWVINETDKVIIAASMGMADEIISWLTRYIIMEDITVTNVTAQYDISVHFTDQGSHSGIKTDYFSIPVFFELKNGSGNLMRSFPPDFHAWRILQGIPYSKKEITPEYNPLELHLWDWISFTKGCYIGQEVIARLETYQKVQKSLYRFRSSVAVSERESIIDDIGTENGVVTSVYHDKKEWIGLAVVRTKDPSMVLQRKLKHSGIEINLEPIYHKAIHGRN